MLTVGMRQQSAQPHLRRLWEEGSPAAKKVIVDAVANNIRFPENVAYYIRESAMTYLPKLNDYTKTSRENTFWWQVMEQMLNIYDIPLASSLQWPVRSKEDITHYEGGTSSGEGDVAKILALMENHFLQEVLFSVQPGEGRNRLLNQYLEARMQGFHPPKQ